MKISIKERNEKIIELYKQGYSYRQICKRYKVSPNTVRKLTEKIQVKCFSCGKIKGAREKFQQHHPDKINRPNYTVPVCVKCHQKITKQEQRWKKSQILQALKKTSENKKPLPSFNYGIQQYSYPSISYEINPDFAKFLALIFLLDWLGKMAQPRPQPPQPKPLTPSERAREYIRQKYGI